MAGRDDATIKVRLDTREAKGDLRGLVRSGQRAAGSIGGTAAGLARGIGGFGLARLGAIGAAVGGAFAIGRPLLGSTFSGIGDVTGEALGGIGAQINEFFLGDLDDKARASKRAREETIAAFGIIAGQQGQIPKGAEAFFNQIKALRTQEERGRSLFEQDERFRGPSISDFLERLLDGIGRLLSELGDKIVEAINPF